MALEDDIRALGARAEASLESLHDYYTHTKIAWQVVRTYIKQVNAVISTSYLPCLILGAWPQTTPNAYLAAGDPVGSGCVVEGARRHLVKDRMERTGMRCLPSGAQAMLDLRATYLNSEWDAFWNLHVTQEDERLCGRIRGAGRRQISSYTQIRLDGVDLS